MRPKQHLAASNFGTFQLSFQNHIIFLHYHSLQLNYCYLLENFPLLNSEYYFLQKMYFLSCPDFRLIGWSPLQCSLPVRAVIKFFCLIYLCQIITQAVRLSSFCWTDKVTSWNIQSASRDFVHTTLFFLLLLRKIQSTHLFYHQTNRSS